MTEQDARKIEEKRIKNRIYQRKYRQKVKKTRVKLKDKYVLQESELKRLDMYVSSEVKNSLQMLSNKLEMSQKEVVEELILTEFNRYYW